MKNYVISVIVCVLLSSLNGLSASPENDLITKMRSYLGNEAQLDGISALQYQGSYAPASGLDGNLTLTFKAPHYQKIEFKTKEALNVICIGENLGYLYSKNLQTGELSRNILGADRYEALKANAVENLNFFKPKKSTQVSVKHLGPITYEGRAAVGILYSYPNGVAFQRYVDPQFGKVLATTTDRGEKTVESGDLMVDGLRFPKMLKSYDSEGTLINTIEFESIAINPDLPDNFFEYSFVK